ncbi:MAG: metallophosphoesterase [Acutalibacteraceae bacterium]|nr:metallophosphoesterase [Acutalibacteraceae bacterium]
MKIFGISDLHLSFETDKPMDVFYGWQNHTDRIKANWTRLVSDEDIVVLPGDLSWALKLSEAKKDFQFIDSLPGKKLLIKGNHDLWWSTAKKTYEFFSENEIKTVDIVFNSMYKAGKYAVCGSRGWLFEKQEDKTIALREAGRLKTSIEAAVKENLTPIVFMHYPPVYAQQVTQPIIDVLKEYSVKKVYHGHIHGSGVNTCIKEFEGISFKLLSCDCIDFTPYFIQDVEK